MISFPPYLLFQAVQYAEGISGGKAHFLLIVSGLSLIRLLHCGPIKPINTPEYIRNVWNLSIRETPIYGGGRLRCRETGCIAGDEPPKPADRGIIGG